MARSSMQGYKEPRSLKEERRGDTTAEEHAAARAEKPYELVIHTGNAGTDHHFGKKSAREGGSHAA